MTQQLDHARKNSVAIVTSSLYSIRNNLTAARYFIALTKSLRDAGFTNILYSTNSKDIPAANAYVFHGHGHQHYHGLSPEKRLTSLMFSCPMGINAPETNEWVHRDTAHSEPPEDYYLLTEEQQLAINQLANRLKVKRNKDYMAGTFQRR